MYSKKIKFVGPYCYGLYIYQFFDSWIVNKQNNIKTERNSDIYLCSFCKWKEKYYVSLDFEILRLL